MQHVKNFLKAFFTAPIVEEEKAPVYTGFCWETMGHYDAAQAVTYHLSSPLGEKAVEEKAQTQTKRPKVGLAGGHLIGPGRTDAGKPLSPTLKGYVIAAGGRTDATVYGLPLTGHRYDDGLWAKFAVDAFVDERLYSDLAKACGQARKVHKQFQLLVTVVHTVYGPKSKYYEASAPFDHEWHEVKYHAVRERCAPVKLVAVEVIVPGDERWVSPVIEGIDVDGMIGVKAPLTAAEKKAKAKAQEAKVARLTKAFASFEELLPPVEAPKVAPVRTASTLEAAADGAKPVSSADLDLSDESNQLDV